MYGFFFFSTFCYNYLYFILISVKQCKKTTAAPPSVISIFHAPCGVHTHLPALSRPGPRSVATLQYCHNDLKEPATCVVKKKKRRSYLHDTSSFFWSYVQYLLSSSSAHCRFFFPPSESRFRQWNCSTREFQWDRSSPANRFFLSLRLPRSCRSAPYTYAQLGQAAAAFLAPRQRTKHAQRRTPRSVLYSIVTTSKIIKIKGVGETPRRRITCMTIHLKLSPLTHVHYLYN